MFKLNVWLHANRLRYYLSVVQLALTDLCTNHVYMQVLSERWAAVWTWAEEWKEKLNQALIDWNKLREEETMLLSWLSSKEQTMDVIGQTDITDEEQVKMHLNLLQV